MSATAHVLAGVGRGQTSTPASLDGTGTAFITSDGWLLISLARNMGSPAPNYVYAFDPLTGEVPEIDAHQSVTVVRALTLIGTV